MENDEIKKKLDEIQAKITLEKGIKISQQDLLDRGVDFLAEHFEEFVAEKVNPPTIDEEKIQRIKENTYKRPTYFRELTDDELIYGLKENG